MRKIEILGTGNGFYPEDGNTSFLLWDEEETEAILIDCGYTVFPKIKELEATGRDIFSKIKTVFISHLHDDHAGSAGMVSIFHYVKTLQPLDFVGINIENVFKYTLQGSDNTYNYTTNNKFDIIKTDHGSEIETCACLINGVFYSGDTTRSLLNTEQAKKAKIIIHEARLPVNNPHHTNFDTLFSAPDDIKKKTYITHYNPNHFEELNRLAKENGFAGVLKQGQIIKY